MQGVTSTHGESRQKNHLCEAQGQLGLEDEPRASRQQEGCLSGYYPVSEDAGSRKHPREVSGLAKARRRTTVAAAACRRPSALVLGGPRLLRHWAGWRPCSQPHGLASWQEEEREAGTAGGLHRGAAGGRRGAAEGWGERLQHHVLHPETECTAVAGPGSLHKPWWGWGQGGVGGGGEEWGTTPPLCPALRSSEFLLSPTLLSML